MVHCLTREAPFPFLYVLIFCNMTHSLQTKMDSIANGRKPRTHSIAPGVQEKTEPADIKKEVFVLIIVESGPSSTVSSYDEK